MRLFWAWAETGGAEAALAGAFAGDEASLSEFGAEGADVEGREAVGSGALGAMDEILPICIFVLRSCGL